LGGDVIQEGITFASRERRLGEVMAERGYVLVHPFDDWDVIHGQGTVARELLDDEPGLEVIAASLGGGGLLAVTAISAKNHSATVKVVGVEPEAADDAYRTWKVGSIKTLVASPKTLADDVRTTAVPLVEYAGHDFSIVHATDVCSKKGRTSRDIMSPRVISVTEETGIDEAARLLIGERIRRVPVIRGGKTVGLLSLSDVLYFFAKTRWTCNVCGWWERNLERPTRCYSCSSTDLRLERADPGH